MSLEIQIAIIAATAAIGGAVVSQIMTFLISLFDKKHQKNVLLRQKYEEMMFHFSASLEWIVHLSGSTSREAVQVLAQCPDARKALSLCLLYFREDLADQANDYVLAQQTFYASVVESFKDGVEATAGAQAIVHNGEKHEAATKNLFNKKNIFENLIISKSEKYTKA